MLIGAMVMLDLRSPMELLDCVAQGSYFLSIKSCLHLSVFPSSQAKFKGKQNEAIIIEEYLNFKFGLCYKLYINTIVTC